jgi:hypothetical protein
MVGPVKPIFLGFFRTPVLAEDVGADGERSRVLGFLPSTPISTAGKTINPRTPVVVSGR